MFPAPPGHDSALQPRRRRSWFLGRMSTICQPGLHREYDTILVNRSSKASLRGTSQRHDREAVTPKLRGRRSAGHYDLVDWHVLPILHGASLPAHSMPFAELVHSLLLLLHSYGTKNAPFGPWALSLLSIYIVPLFFPLFRLSLLGTSTILWST